MAKPKIGNAKYGGTQKKYWKLKDGESVFRIIPPLGELADQGKWSVFYKIHYGYKNAAGKSRPFQSSEVKNRKGMAEVGDPALDRINLLKGKLEAAKKAGDKKTVDALLTLVGGAKSIYNLDSNHYVNAIDEQGNIGVLKLRHRAKLALDATIKELRDKGIDPLSVDGGRFFSFRRSGNALDTSFQVTVKTQRLIATVDGQQMEVEKPMVHKLTEEIINRLGDEAAELGKLFRAPSAEEIQQIVDASELKSGIVQGIDDILGIQTQGGGAAAVTEEVFDDSADYTEETTASAPAQAVQQPAAVQATPLAAVQTKTEVKTETTKVAPKAELVSSPQTTAQTVSDMSVDDFLADLGLGSK
jgi:hypothetical protein